MLSLFRKRLLFKISALLFSVFLLAGGFSIAYITMRNSDNLIQKLDEYTTGLLLFAKNNYALPLYNFDTDNIENVNRSLLSNNIITAVNVYSYSEFTSGLKKNAAGNMIKLKEPFTISNNKFERLLRREIVYKDQIIGSIEIFYSVESVNDEIHLQTLQLIAVFSVVFLMMLGALFLNLRREIIRPIVNLADISKKIAAEHQYDILLISHGEDEIGVLYDGFKNMLRNIAERDGELKKIKSYLSNIIESMPSMLITVDDKGVVTQWNQAASKFTGIQATEIMGRNLLQMIPVLSEYMTRTKDVLDSKKPLHFYRTHLNDNQSDYKNISLYPLVANGVKGMVIRIDDITELEEKDEQLRQIQKMEMIGTLVGGLAHDFNNVLGGIVGTLSVIKYKLSRSGTLEPEFLLNHLQIIEESGQRAVDMVSQLLAISRKQELSLAAVDLNLSVKHVMKICQNTFDKSIELRPQLQEFPSMIMADPTQMEQVILNLCVNASHAMTIMRKSDDKQGGVLSVVVDEIAADKHFCYTHPESEEIVYVRLVVGDTGVGMEQRIVAKIFEPFFTTKEKGRGTGLGLSMVYNIVRQHKGFIDVYSEVGIGTTFNVYLPKLFDPEAVRSGDEETQSYEAGEGLILVVDDDINMRKLATIMLEECGYTVISAENGLDGVARFIDRQSEIKMVLLDLIMPKMSGKEAFLELKKINPSIKVLLSSGFRQDERVDEVLNLGCNGFIQKPYTMAKLSRKVSELSGQKKL